MKSLRFVLPSVLALAALPLLAACGHENKPAESPAREGSIAVTSAQAAKPASAVSMSDDLRHVCGIEDTGAAPKFDFDSVVLNTTDRSELDQLATCMTTGPLKGKNIQLVGRADPRGEAEYNMNLGATRANAVQHYLAQLGVSNGRLNTTSRGALDAQGHDDASWAADRRVDLELAGK
ncbi:MAG TPA: OmpA family protein [Polyangiaceae bacterium]|jgi:peptidoglycan-associated lipoprotein